jgi:hypothetical protein
VSGSRFQGVGAGAAVLLSLAAFVLGVLLTVAVTAVALRLIDDSRPSLALQNLVSSSMPGFADDPVPSISTCGDRFGCVEGVEGDGVSMYRYLSLDLARQAVIYNDADLYRSDRIVIEFEEGVLSDDERFAVLQVTEGTWTGSSD